MDPLLEVFFEESSERLADCEEALVLLEAEPQNVELLNRIFRAAHTFKSNSAMLGFHEVSRLTHALEDLLDPLRRGQRTVRREIVDTLLISKDLLRNLLGRARAGNAAPEREEVEIIDRTIARLHAFVQEPAAPTTIGDAPALAEATADDESFEALAASPPRAADWEEATSIRVPVGRVDRLINLVGELVIAQSIVSQISATLPSESASLLQEAVAQMDRHARELHERVMSMRMLPLRQLFGCFPRLVRDLTASVGKQATLEIRGEETELDKTVIEKIRDPLVHLLRNAIDHGLELPAERAAQGKPEAGRLQVEAYQQGGRIFIEVADDGQGLDCQRIRARAVREGLMEADQVLSDDEAFALIFRPGFSTADQITEISGRGVGMDVVKRNLAALGGSITIESTPREGSRFRIALPLTVAMLDGQSVQVGDQIYLLPLVSILESVRPEQGSVHTIAGRSEVVRVRDRTLPLLRLHRLFGIRANVIDPERGLVVIVEHAGRQAAVLVDEVLGQQQVVIKSLESGFGRIEGVAGATILGDGRVALILDVAELMALGGRRRSEITPCTTEDEPQIALARN